MRVRLAAIVLGVTAAACVPDGTGGTQLAVDGGSVGAPDAGSAEADGGTRDAAVDAGIAGDAGPRDAASQDAAIDAGLSDAGLSDAGLSDAGLSDAGLSDAGVAVDAGFLDAGEPDAGTVDAGPSDAGPVPDAGVPPGPTPPVYSGGTCPVLVAGDNIGFASGGESRSFLLRVPTNPVGASVVFAWHWLGGNPTDASDWMGLTAVSTAEPVIVVAPYSCCSSSEWQFTAPPANVDIALFDDILACLADQWQVDMTRIYSTGHSAGALFNSLLVQHRANYLAGIATLSGGLLGSYTMPAAPIPALLVWGGPTDTFGSFSFESATLALSSNLRSDGHFVVHCSGTFGHQLPPDPNFVWPFFRDHPRGIQPEPYAAGLPLSMPAYCFIP